MSAAWSSRSVSVASSSGRGGRVGDAAFVRLERGIAFGECGLERGDTSGRVGDAAFVLLSARRHAPGARLRAVGRERLLRRPGVRGPGARCRALQPRSRARPPRSRVLARSAACSWRVVSRSVMVDCSCSAWLVAIVQVLLTGVAATPSRSASALIAVRPTIRRVRSTWPRARRPGRAAPTRVLLVRPRRLDRSAIVSSSSAIRATQLIACVASSVRSLGVRASSSSRSSCGVGLRPRPGRASSSPICDPRAPRAAA